MYAGFLHECRDHEICSSRTWSRDCEREEGNVVASAALHQFFPKSMNSLDRTSKLSGAVSTQKTMLPNYKCQSRLNGVTKTNNECCLVKISQHLQRNSKSNDKSHKLIPSTLESKSKVLLDQTWYLRANWKFSSRVLLPRILTKVKLWSKLQS